MGAHYLRGHPMRKKPHGNVFSVRGCNFLRGDASNGCMRALKDGHSVQPRGGDNLFMELLERNRQLINKVCYMYATDGEHFKDLCQEVATNLWQGYESFRGESAESTWVYRVALNTCVSYFRRQNGRRVETVALENAACVEADNGERAEQLREMYRLISTLGKIDKALILLWLDEKSYDEMAEITGLSRSNVASRLHRARQRLAKQAHL